MKLTKAKLIKKVKQRLEATGFTEFKDTIGISQGLFIKKLKDNFYLSLGLNISRFSDSLFTSDFYLSQMTRFSSLWGDIPSGCYERICKFLNQEERKLYLSDEFIEDGIIDCWWDGNDDKEIEKFLKVVEITETRFINQLGLIDKIKASKEIEEIVKLTEQVKMAVNSDTLSNNLSFQPNKELDDIPIIWFKAAETVLKNNNCILNNNTVKLLAADAWRQNVLSKT
jgi:hypothetical protein